MDYPHRERLKLLGHLRAYELADRPDLALQFSVGNYRGGIEQLVTVTVEALDWNCPQHITPRFTLKETGHAMVPPRARIAELELQLSKFDVGAA